MTSLSHQCTSAGKRTYRRKFSGLFATAMAFLFTAGMAAAQGSPHVRISRLYGAGGNNNAVLKADYVELVNASPSTVSIDGWSLQYAAAGETSNFTSKVLLSGSIPPGGYFLISLASAGNIGADLPTPDLNFTGATPTLQMAAANGRVALVNSSETLTSTVSSGPTIVDFVGFGTAFTYEGTSAAPAPSTTNAIIRAGDGATDTDQNGSDFSTIPAATNLPKNSASPPLAVGPDVTPPAVSHLTPANAATGVALDSNLVIQFNESVAPGGGAVRLYDSANPSTPVEIFTVAAGNITGTTATFDPAASLSGGASYHVLVDANAFVDLASTPNAFPGISSPSVWAFTAGAPPAAGPVPVAFSPANGATNVPLATATLDITFDRNVIAGTGSILIKDASTNLEVQNINVSTLAFLENYNVVNIDIAPLNAGVSYYVEIPGGVFRDAADNDPSDAIGGASTWAFTMIPPDLTPPAVSTLIPASASTYASPVGEMRIIFDEPVKKGLSGNILIKRVSDGITIETIPIGSDAVTIQELMGGTTANPVSLGQRQLVIARSIPLLLSTSYYLEISPGAIEDLAGNDFDGFSGPTGWPFTTATVTVVVNKYANNIPADVIELLVVGNQTPGTFVNMGDMIIKDFSASMVNDGGGKFKFNSGTIWDTVPVGTLIVITPDLTSSDVTTNIATGDFVLRVGLLDTNYFTAVPTPLTGATRDIATTDMIMIKQKDASDPPLDPSVYAAGTIGGIHTFGAGAPGTQFINTGGPKLIANGQTTAGGDVAIANNSNATLYDFFGADATGSLDPAEASIVFGTPHSPGNAAFIAMLRGLDSSQGNGAVTLVNSTPSSPFIGSGIFGRGLVSQSATLGILANAPGVTLTQIVLTVPGDLTTTLNSSTVAISGAGAAGASLAFSGQTITISGAAVTQVAGINLVISGISTPSAVSLADDGIYMIDVKTAGGTATPETVAVNPAVRVVIPIENIRDILNGVPVDAGKFVAIEGVVTEEHFGVVGTNGVIQDLTGGMVIYSPTLTAPETFVRGKRFAVLGQVKTFRGLAEVEYYSNSNLIDLGADVEPAPQVVTVAQFLADPEAYESKLIKFENLSPLTGEMPGWQTGVTFLLQDAAGNQVPIRLPQGVELIVAPTTYPVDVVGIMGQYHPSAVAAPISNTGYQFQPRGQADITAGTAPAGFADWLLTNDPDGSLSDDHDGDGVPNGVEYFFGLTGSGFTANPGLVNGKIKWPDAGVPDLTYAVQISTTLLEDSWEDVPATSLDLNETGFISYTPPVPTPGQPKLFIRFLVEQE